MNASAREVTWEMKENRDPRVVITAEKMAEAKSLRLVVSRQANIDGEPAQWNLPVKRKGDG